MKLNISDIGDLVNSVQLIRRNGLIFFNNIFFPILAPASLVWPQIKSLLDHLARNNDLAKFQEIKKISAKFVQGKNYYEKKLFHFSENMQQMTNEHYIISIAFV